MSGRFSLDYALQKHEIVPTCEHIYLPLVFISPYQSLTSSVRSKTTTRSGMSVAVLPPSSKRKHYLQAVVTYLTQK